MDDMLSIPRPEIAAPPSVSNLAVAQAGPGIFTVTMQVVMLVRFPSENTAAAGPLVYGSGESPQAEGEPEAFQAFVQAMGYPPQTRDVLIQWAAAQGGS
jgi:hypothetical protein